MNAREELLEAVKESGSTIKCADIKQDHFRLDTPIRHTLPVGHSTYKRNKFLASLDFDYDNSYGLQFLHGTVWLEDGTWLSRGEYDGSEWWVHNVLPPIPDELL